MPIKWNPTGWIGDLIEKRMHVAGQAMVGLAKAYAAVDTGQMRASIYYTYAPDQKLLTLHCDVPWAWYNELGTYKMKPHPFMRPAMNAVAPAFLTGKLMGVSTQIMAGTYNDEYHKPRMIKPKIRPHIASANAEHNIGATTRARFTAVHMNRDNEVRRYTKGASKVRRAMMSDLGRFGLNKIRKAWN